jgi:peptidoglycan/LPS O-acetylase OafA/YrhL
MYRWQLFGIGLAIWLRARRRISWWHLAALAGVGLVAEDIHTPDLPSVLVLAAAVGLMVVAATGPDWTWLRWGPARRTITWLAGISYGVYLLNQQIGYFAAWLLDVRLGMHGWLRLGLVLALAVLLGWLITVLVERPAYRWLTRPRIPTQRGKDAAADRNRSFCSGEPTVTRQPNPSNARTTTLPSSVCSENSTARSPSGSQTKLACDGGTS